MKHQRTLPILLAILLSAVAVQAKTIKIERIHVKGGAVNIFPSNTDKVESFAPGYADNDYTLNGTTLTVRSGVLNIGVRAIKELTVENRAVCNADLLEGSSRLALSVINAICNIREVSVREITIHTETAQLNITALKVQQPLSVTSKMQSVVKIHDISAPAAGFIVEKDAVVDLSDIDTQSFKMNIAEGCVAGITDLQASDIEIDSGGNVLLEGQCKEARLTSRANNLNASGLRAVNVKLQRKGGYISEPASGEERTRTPRSGRILP